MPYFIRLVKVFSPCQLYFSPKGDTIFTLVDIAPHLQRPFITLYFIKTVKVCTGDFSLSDLMDTE